MVGKILQRLAVAAAAAMLVAGAATPAAAQTIDRVLVVVNDGVITESEYIDAMRRTVFEYRARGQEVPERRELEEQVVEQLILERIQMQMADRAGITVTPAQVDRAISEIARRQGLTAEQLVQEAGRVGLSPAKYRSEIEKQIRIQRLVDREVRRRVVLSEAEIEERAAMLAAQDEAANVEYEVAHISLLLDDPGDQDARDQARELAREIAGQLADGADFAELARTHSDSPTAADGGYLGWRTADNLPDLFLAAVRSLGIGETSGVIDGPEGFHLVRLIDRRGGDSAMVEQWRVRHILVAPDQDRTLDEARETAERLRERILQGDDFAELARVHSADQNSRVRGGDLGWVSPGDTVPAFEETLKNLELNELSEPIETQFGLHLIEVLDRRRQDAGEDRLRVQAERQLQEEKGREAYEQWLRRIRDEAYVRFRVKPG